MRKGRERSKCYYILLFCEIVFTLYEIKMENKKNFFVKLGIFCLELGKNILFGIGNGAEISAPKSGD